VIDAGEPWTDPEFPPQQSSIALPGEMPQPSSHYEWKRASEIWSDFDVFKGDIRPTDLNQGELGNCYYLAVLSASAEKGQNIKKRFMT